MGSMSRMQGHRFDYRNARSWVRYHGFYSQVMGSMSRMQGHGFYSQVMGLIPRMQDNGFDSQDFHCIQGCTLDAIKVALDKMHEFKCK